jgi:sporulation protein YunB
MRRHFQRFMIKSLLVILVLLVVLALLRSRLYPVIRSLAETQVKNTASDLINDAIAEQIAAGNIQYDRIVYFEKDLDGRITALKTNISEVNRLKTDILNIINDEILALDTSDIGIPIGSFIFPELLSGKGPVIPVHILSIRNSDASFYSNFHQAGINQTLHQLTMEVSVDVAVLALGETNSFTMTSEVVVAETVIVGAVPNTYLQTGGIYGSEKENQRTD